MSSLLSPRYSLYLDEPLSPSETVLKGKFFAKSNINYVVGMVRGVVDDENVSYGRVVDVMDDVFTQFLGGAVKVTDGSSTINTLNLVLADTFVQRKLSSSRAHTRSHHVGFENNMIPQTILDRASFSTESDEMSYEFI